MGCAPSTLANPEEPPQHRQAPSHYTYQSQPPMHQGGQSNRDLGKGKYSISLTTWKESHPVFSNHPHAPFTGWVRDYSLSTQVTRNSQNDSYQAEYWRNPQVSRAPALRGPSNHISGTHRAETPHSNVPLVHDIRGPVPRPTIKLRSEYVAISYRTFKKSI